MYFIQCHFPNTKHTNYETEPYGIYTSIDLLGASCYPLEWPDLTVIGLANTDSPTMILVENNHKLVFSNWYLHSNTCLSSLWVLKNWYGYDREIPVQSIYLHKYQLDFIWE